MKRTLVGHAQEQPSEAESSATMSGLKEIITSSGISVRLWRLYAYFWLVCLVFPLLDITHKPLTPIDLLIALSGLAIFAAIYIWVMWPYPLRDFRSNRYRPASTSAILIGITLLVLFLSLAYGSAFTWLFLGVSAISGVILPARRAFWTVSGLTLLTLAVSVIVSGGILGTDWLQVIPLVLLVRGLGLDVTGLHRLVQALQELNEARRELARQAVMEERLRMARDLHDLLGRSLSLITLKSELAGRLVDNDPSQAIQEIHEVEYVARQALREVRQAVAGYRQQSLTEELDGARQILEAAGISCQIEHIAETMPPEIDTALAWAVREGVTNVIRHSRATQCQIRIDHVGTMIQAEVINDGYRVPRQMAKGGGNGLPGLAERIAALEGKIDAGPTVLENHAGFHLMVKIPVQGKMALQEAQLR